MFHILYNVHLKNNVYHSRDSRNKFTPPSLNSPLGRLSTTTKMSLSKCCTTQCATMDIIFRASMNSVCQCVNVGAYSTTNWPDCISSCITPIEHLRVHSRNFNFLE